MFTAISPTKQDTVYISAETYLTFEGMHLNHGKSFDPKNGLFIAPENGTYKLSFTTHVYTSLYIDHVTLVIEKNEMEQLTYSTNGYPHGNWAFSWMMSLQNNDQVKIKLKKGRLQIRKGSVSNSARQMIWSGMILNSCSVAFSSYMNFPETTSSGPLKFDKFLVNVGHAFDMSIFKAPLDGVFEFSFTVTQYFGEAQIDVTKNNIVILSFSSDDKQYTSFGASWLIQLEKDDEIQLIVARGSIISDTDKTKIFNGHLLQYQTTEAVLFCVFSNSGGKILTDAYILFDKLLLANIGGGYDIETGKFKAPIKGTYEFSLTVNSDDGYGGVFVERNGTNEWGFYSRSVAHSSIGPTWIMHLNQYDTIRLRVQGVAVYTDSQNNRIFSGKLIKKG